MWVLFRDNELLYNIRWAVGHQWYHLFKTLWLTHYTNNTGFNDNIPQATRQLLPLSLHNSPMYYFTNAIVVTTWMRTKRYIIARCCGQASLLLWIGRSCHFAFIYGEGIRIFYFQTVRLDIFTHIAMTECGIPKAQSALDHYPTASSVIIAKLIQPGQWDERLLITMKGGSWILSSWSADSDNR